MPAPSLTFDGIAANGSAPPDGNIAVGPTHVVETVNSRYQVFNKAGTSLLGPINTNAIWSGFGGLCETTNRGDPVVIYDQLADRWFITQFAFQVVGPTAVPPYHQCIAISTTPDPTGTWNRYDFMVSGNLLPDYGKFGLWPDGYYGTFRNFLNGLTWDGIGAVVFERTAMLQGLPARMVQFTLTGFPDGMLPSSLDGTAPPVGAPNSFLQFGSPMARYDFHVDWANPLNSTFGVGANHTPNQNINVAFFNLPGIAGVPQSGTVQTLDILPYFLMFRLQYRNFGSTESLVVTHSVMGSLTTNVGVRWYEFRRSGGVGANYLVRNQGTYSPTADSRWMGSAALDAQGNLAIGYSLSSATAFPSILIAGRLFADTVNNLAQGEALMFSGAGSQTGLSRWGDYTSMMVDPADGCTFWYVNQYQPATGSYNWNTRIGKFSYAGCGTPVQTNCPCTLFTNNQVPAIPAALDFTAYELGTKFFSDVPGFITGLRFYKGAGNNGPHIGQLWTGAGAPLATVQFSNETATGWQQANFANAVPIAAATNYVVSYSVPQGHYSYDPNFFNAQVNRPPLHGPAGPGNGLVSFTPNTFPTLAATNNGNFWVDPVFSVNAPAPAVCPCSLFSPGATPANASWPDGSPYTLGVKFKSDQAGFVSAIRFYKGAGNGGTHVGRLWSNTGALLSTATFVGETATGWQQVNLSQPVAISPNTVYIASYDAPMGNFALNSNFFNAQFDNAPLHAPAGPGNGVVAFGTGAFPTLAAANNSNFWVDVVFTDSAPPPPGCPCTLLGANSIPAVANHPDTNAYNLGVKFKADSDGFVTGIRFFKGASNTGLHTGFLWTTGGTLLNNVTFTGETASGWQTALFGTPTFIQANTVYIASYTAPNGRFSYDANFFASSSLDHAPLHAPRSADVGGNSVAGIGVNSFPGIPATGGGYFWVDLIFNTSATPIPSNDDFNSAKVITSMPYTNTQNTRTATTAVDDPILACIGAQKFKSVWYDFTPVSTGVYSFQTSGSGYDTIVAVWSGPRGSLGSVGCDDDSGPGYTSLLNVFLTAGVTYHIEVTGFLNDGGDLILTGQTGPATPIMGPEKNRPKGDGLPLFNPLNPLGLGSPQGLITPPGPAGGVPVIRAAPDQAIKPARQ